VGDQTVPRHRSTKGFGAAWWGGDLTPEQLEYSRNDVRYLLPLSRQLTEQLKAAGLWDLFLQEMELLQVVARMELHGFALDRLKLQLRLDPLRRSAQEARIQALSALGKGCPKLGDHAGLKQWFTDKFGVALLDVKEDTLLACEHPAAQALASVTKMERRVKLFEELLDGSKEDGKIHASFNQLGARTGRFSCSGPNLQNQERGDLFRACFISSGPDRVLVVADYNSIELRVAALIAQDDAMIEAFRAGQDLHRITAALMVNKPPDAINKAERQRAKPVNFGLLYAQKPPGLKAYALKSYGVQMSLQEATRYREQWFGHYRGIAAWHQKAQEIAAEISDVRTVSGHRQLLTQADCYWNRLQALLNTTVQGGAAALIKRALVFLHHALPEDCHIVATVHDEIIVDVPRATATAVKLLMENTMAEAFTALFGDLIPGPADATICETWKDK
jgi:DNA polymerase I